MFSWLEEVERKSFDTVMPEHKSFRIEKMQLETITTSITELGQLFTAASFLLSDNTMVQLPARDLIARNLIISEIAPHFKEVKVMLIDNKIEVVMMQYLKDTSRQILQDLFLCGLYPVVSDMYRSKEMNLHGSHKPRRAIQRYRVKDEWLEPLQLTGTLSIQQFVESGYFIKG
jgi:hypothetical protein